LFVSCFDSGNTTYCLSEDKCITLLKMQGGEAYIVQGKHKGNLELKKDYIKTKSTQALTFYFSDDMPGKIIVRNQGNFDNESGYELIGSQNNVFIEFDEQLNNQLYSKNAKKFNEVNAGVNYIDLVIKDNYAIDKDGVHIK